MTTVKTNEFMKFKVASVTPNNEKSTFLQSGWISLRDFRISSLSTIPVFILVHEKIGSIIPFSIPTWYPDIKKLYMKVNAKSTNNKFLLL